MGVIQIIEKIIHNIKSNSLDNVDDLPKILTREEQIERIQKEALDAIFDDIN